MIGFIKGILRDKDLLGSITVEVGGVGFLISVTNGCMANLPDIDEEVKIYTYMQVKEDELSLFGFVSPEEKKFFMQLISVSGVGSKTALQILSAERMTTLISSIINEDASVIANCKGIGKKTAERIIVELKDKIKPFDYILPNETSTTVNIKNTAVDDAVVVLTSLGINKNEAVRLAKEVYEDGDTGEQIVAKALHNMGN